MYITIKENLTEEDILTYKKKYLSYSIKKYILLTIFSTIAWLTLLLFGECHVEGFIKILLTYLTCILMFIYTTYVLVSNIIWNIKERKKDTLEFSTKKGLFREEEIYKNEEYTYIYFVGDTQIYTSGPNNNFYKYTGLETTVYFFNNNNGDKIAFLANFNDYPTNKKRKTKFKFKISTN